MCVSDGDFGTQIWAIGLFVMQGEAYNLVRKFGPCSLSLRNEKV